MLTFLVSKIMFFTVFLQNIKKINGHLVILFLYVGQSIKKQRYHFADKGSYSQRYGFSGSHVWMWELDHKEGWALKNGCFWTVVPEKTLKSLLDCKESKPVNPKRNQPWIFIGKTDAETEAPILWPPDAKSRLIGKDANAGKDWGKEEKGMTEDEMAGWHYWLNGHKFESTPGDSEGQGSLACYSPWGCKESDMTDGTATKTTLASTKKWREGRGNRSSIFLTFLWNNIKCNSIVQIN